MPSGESKSSILGAIERAQKRVPLAVALRVLGLSASRYHTWLRLDQSCGLDDRSSCPRTVPTQLTRQEISTVHDMAIAMEFRHMFGRGDHVPEQLAEARRLARQARLETNRNLSCEACRSPITAVGPIEPVPPAKREPQ